MVLPKPNVQPAPAHMNTYSTLPQDEPQTVITRHSATQYLVLNSKDRFLVGQPSTKLETDGTTTTRPGGVAFQNWNNFKLQRPQNLMESFATRLVVSEVRFPYWIPNINERNNTIWIRAEINAPGEQYAFFKIVVPTGFYTPSEFKTALQNAMDTATVLIDAVPVGMKQPPLVDYANGAFTMSVNPVNALLAIVLQYRVQSLNPQHQASVF